MIAPVSNLFSVNPGDARIVLAANHASTDHASGTESPSEAHGKGAFPPFETKHYVSQLVWLAIAFGLLYLLMSRIALPRIATILQHRSDRITADVAAAKAAQAHADEAEKEQVKTLAEARAKAQALAQETHAKLASEADAQRKALEAELNAKIAASEAQIDQIRKKAMENVASIATDAAAAIIQRISGSAADSSKIAAAIAASKAG